MALEVITYTHNLMNQNIYDTFEFMNDYFRSLMNQGNKYEPKKTQIYNAWIWKGTYPRAIWLEGHWLMDFMLLMSRFIRSQNLMDSQWKLDFTNIVLLTSNVCLM